MFIYEFYLKPPHTWITGWEVFSKYVRSCTNIAGNYWDDPDLRRHLFPIPNRRCKLEEIPKKLRSFDVGLWQPRFFCIGFSFERHRLEDYREFAEVFDVRVTELDDMHYFSVARWIMDGVPDRFKANEAWFTAWKWFCRRVAANLIRERMMQLAEGFFQQVADIYFDVSSPRTESFVTFHRPYLRRMMNDLMDYSQNVFSLCQLDFHADIRKQVRGSFGHLLFYLDKTRYHYGLNYEPLQEWEGFFVFPNLSPGWLGPLGGEFGPTSPWG